MASSCDEPPVRRKRKAPDEVITKNVVVLRSSQVCEMDGVVLMPNTTLKISDIKKNGQSGKLSFTKSTSSTEMERSLQQTFPFLAESNSRIYSAKAVDGKSKLDFCGQRRMWSGEETNRIITGNRALYIYCKEEISKHCPLLPAQVENLQISGTVSSSDNWDSGFETCGISQDNSSDQRRVPLFNNNITNSPADGAFDEDSSNLGIQLSFSMQEDLEKTYQNYESSDNSIFGVPCEAVPDHSNVESEEAYHCAEQENSNSNVEAEEANYGAEQGNLIQKIGPSSGPVEGGGNFLITVSEELPDCIDSGFAYFGSNHAVLTKLNKFTFEGIIPAAQQPGVVRVCVYSDTNRFLGETDFEYEDMMDRVAFHAVQLGSEGVSKLYALMAKHSINMWNQSSSVKQISELSGQATGTMNDSCQERSSLAEDIVIADENDDLAQDLQDLINWLSEENYHPVHTNRGMWLKISKVANGLCKKLAFSEDVDPQESEEDYFADAENSSCTSSDDDGTSLSDLAGWSECLNDSPLSLPLVYTRLSKSQEANPKAESTQHLNKPVNIGLDVSHGIPATVTEGFTSEPSIGDNKYVGSGDFLEWNTPPPESKMTKVNAVNEDQDTEQDLSQEWVFSSEESTSCTRLASQDDNSMLDLPAIDVDIKGSLYQDDELLKTPHTENAKSQNLELSLSITSMQKSAAHDGPSTQDATQSPSKDPLQNGTGNRKSNVVPSQYSNKDITDNSGQEWAKSAITEGLDSWFDPCEIEDGGKNEHSRWEMLSIEPNNTDGGVEEDNLDREQEHGLFSEEENLYTHLPSPDDTSVRSLGPEAENKESQVRVEFSDEKDSVSLEGPPQEVEKAQESLETFIRELKVSMDFAEITVDHKFHPHIIGKNGSNVNRIKTETGTSILIPSNNEKSNVLRIEGSPKGVALAKAEILQMVKKLENEKTKDILIDQRFHRTIIGTKGEKIREIRQKYPEVQISFPDAGKKSDIVNLRGPREDVDSVYTLLKNLNSELIAANFRVEVPIFKQFHKNVIGRGGATIKKANVTQIEMNIPHKHHNVVIGDKGRRICSIMDDCGGVSIKFPPEGTNSDKVLIRGPKDDVGKAKKQPLELLNEKETNSAKPQHHRFLIGRGGSSIRKVRENTRARIVFPTPSDEDKELITIIGKKKGVEAAKQELMKAIKDLDNIVEGEVHVDPKHHKYFVAKRGEKLREIADDFGGVVVSFPRNGVNSDRVVLKGAKDCIEGAKKRILEIVDELDSMVSIECVIPQKYHRNIMGAKGVNVQKATSHCNVQIRFPDRDLAARGQGMVNGSSSPVEENGEEAGSPPASPRKCDVITIIGSKDNAEAAKEALLELVPITETMTIPFDYHRFIIGAKGANVRQMMDEFDVNISIPPSKVESDQVIIVGTRPKVNKAIEALEQKVSEIEAENEDRQLRSFKLEITVASSYHPKIIGRKGQVIQKIRSEHGVQIQFPPVESSEVDADKIILTGYEHNCEAAKAAIFKIVHELEDQVSVEVPIDPRVHRRLIGTKGRAIRKFMDTYRVDIRFPSLNTSDPVLISGLAENVEEAKDQLLLLEEEYMQDVRDEIEQHDVLSHYMNPPSKQSNQAGFVVRDAPWDNVRKGDGGRKQQPPPQQQSTMEKPLPPDTTNIADFPCIGSSAAAPRPTAWGPARH